MGAELTHLSSAVTKFAYDNAMNALSNGAPTRARTAALRAALVSLTSTLAGALLVVGIVALFSVWSMNRAWRDGLESTDGLRALAADAAQIQVEFKIGVQEWKNVLLRGSDPDDLDHYREAFELRQAAVATQLIALEAGATAAGLEAAATEIAALRAGHAAQLNAYRQSLAAGLAGAVDPERPVLDAAAARRIDRAVRGIDRELEQRIDVMREDIDTLARREREALNHALDERYETLRLVLTGLLLASSWRLGADCTARFA